jgi:hypothetical protein
LGLVGAAVTMLARKATRRAMYDERGEPKLPRAARKANSMTMLLIVAAATGAALALGDVLQHQRRELTETT